MSDVTLTTSVTLNGEAVDITVYEDIDNTGVTDNSETINGISGGTNTYTLSSLSGGSGNAYWAKLSLSTSNVTSSPVAHSVTLDIPTAGTIVLINSSGVIQTSTTVIDTE